jgi:soluble lytic murein transglycosylase
MDMFKLTLICWLSLLSFAVNADASNQQRSQFLEAQKALRINQLTQYRALRSKLDDYPLAPYLDYQYLLHRLNHKNAAEVEEFLSVNEGTFYAKRLRAAWLKKLAKAKQWKSYLNAYRPNLSSKYQCLRLQALLATGHKALAFAETPPLWLVPESQDDACDPVFKAWKQSGKLSEDLRWQRILEALEHSQFSLAEYLARSLSDSSQAMAWIRRWQQIHRNPIKLLKQLPATPPSSNRVSLTRDLPLSRKIILHGIERLAQRDPHSAYQAWQRIHPAYSFSNDDKLAIRKQLGRWAALSRDQQALNYFGDAADSPWKARAALWLGNWQAAKQAILELKTEELHSIRWQYWLGRSLAELGEQDAAQQILLPVAKERDYYGFLAADRLARPYQMNHKPIQFTEAEMTALKSLPAVQRLHEFFLLDMKLEARREAYALKQSLPTKSLQLLAILTDKWGWHNQTIALLGKAKYWDALDLRFPVLFDNEVEKASKSNQLDPSWLFAVARQESAFNSQARSHVGAMGLMQLMPQTGKLIAKLINRPLRHTRELYQPDRNISLGSAYLKRMYDENQRNPVLATAAYNAGPSRVNQWLPEGQLDADIWIENIPFNETRSYVRSVMSYAAIFDYQRKQTITPLSKRMPVIQPEKP